MKTLALTLCLVACSSASNVNPASPLCDSRWNIAWHEPTTCIVQGTLTNCHVICPGDGKDLQCGDVTLHDNEDGTVDVTRGDCAETVRATITRN